MLREKEINRTGELPLPESNPADLTRLLRFLFTLDCVNCEIFFSVPKLKMLIMVERYFFKELSYSGNIGIKFNLMLDFVRHILLNSI